MREVYDDEIIAAVHPKIPFLKLCMLHSVNDSNFYPYLSLEKGRSFNLVEGVSEVCSAKTVCGPCFSNKWSLGPVSCPAKIHCIALQNGKFSRLRVLTSTPLVSFVPVLEG